MAKPTLPVNFKDDILDESMNGKRRYNLIQNSDGTVSLEDVTDYSQIGSNFGAVQMNSTNNAVNESVDKAVVIDNKEDLMANTTNGKVAGALAVKDGLAELNGKLISGKFSVSAEIDTGETWVDGKKIYRRTFKTTQLISGGVNLAIPTNLEGVADAIWLDVQNSYIRTSSLVYPIPLEHYNGGDDYITVWCNTASIRLYSNSGWNAGWEKVITIRYTKK